MIKTPISIVLVLITLASLILTIKDEAANEAIVSCLDGKKCIGSIIAILGIVLGEKP